MENRIVFVIPSRERPSNIARLGEAWRELAAGYSDVVVCVDHDEPQLDNYRAACCAAGFELRIGDRLGLAGTTNEVALERLDGYRAVGSIGDDHVPRTLDFDLAMLGAVNMLRGGVVYPNDLLQGPRIATAAVMSTDLIEALGYMAAPGMRHLCIDLAWLDVGLALGRVRYLPHVILEHLHPAAGKAPTDDGYRQANSPAMVNADTAAYLAWRDRLPETVAGVQARLGW